jgi:hypothetical protein
VDTIGLDRDLPALPGARRNAKVLQDYRQKPGGDLFARGDHGIVFARIVDGGGLAAPAHQPVGRSGHRRHHDRHMVASLHFALDMASNIADAANVRNRGAPEFHNQSAHGPKPLIIPRRPGPMTGAG